MFSDKFATAAALLDKSTFMEDFATSSEDDNEAITLYYEMTALLQQIRLPMAKWATNSIPLKDIWKAEGQKTKQQTTVLGVSWDTESDSLIFEHREITDRLQEEPAKKRQVLHTISRFYDPLGILSPISIVGKIIFQDTWRRGIKWDEILPSDFAARWHIWISSLSHLSVITVSRCLGMSNRIQEASQVHVFCDASERAYGAVLYVRTQHDDNIIVRLACSKNRVSPVKKVTLPRLELLAALMGSRLLNYFCKSTGYAIRNATMWSDSVVALDWIRSDPNRWKTFACNRVTEIQENLTPAQWRHCLTDNNPADLVSRGMSPQEIESSTTWWQGPPWLNKHPETWPTNVFPEDPLPEIRKTHQQVLTTSTWEPPIDASKHSSYWKVLHMMAWILRFIHNARHSEKLSGHLTARELEPARLRWIRMSQQESFIIEYSALSEKTGPPGRSKIGRFNPFLQDGLIRLGGRLQYAELSKEEKHPLLLDGSHPFVKLPITQTHIRLHHLGVRIVLSELRREFWILKARQSVKKVIHRCLPCKIAKNDRGREIEAPLPADRVQLMQPFAVTGIDFAGPLYIKVGSRSQKSYIVLFTCATTRALHLELASDMSTEKFLMAFRRFCGRRGVPHTVYSDNAKTFQAANKELAILTQLFTSPLTNQHFAHLQISWKFIAPRAA